MSVPTPHIAAKEGDVARTGLMPGDPLRSRFIAETYLDNPVLVNNTRGVQGYTGTYKGKRVSVMAKLREAERKPKPPKKAKETKKDEPHL